MTPPSPELEKLLRWEAAGGAWELESDDGTTMVVGLLRCDGGERMDVVVSADARLRAYVLTG